MGGRVITKRTKIMSATLLVFQVAYLISQVSAGGLDDMEFSAINILVFYDDLEFVSHLDIAVDFINQNPSLRMRIGNITKMFSDGQGVFKLIDELCKEVEGRPEGSTTTDLALDFTRHANSSNDVKSLVRILKIPTVSTNSAPSWSWKGMVGTNASSYLISIPPPSDILLQFLRTTITNNPEKSTNAVILLNQQFEKVEKYPEAPNSSARQIIADIKRYDEALQKRIDRLVQADISNFFIANIPNEVKSVPGNTSDQDVKNSGYFNDDFSWFSMSMGDRVPRCTGCRDNISVTHLSPDFKNMGMKRQSFLASMSRSIMDLKKARGKKMELDLNDLFYFDIAVNTFLAVGKMKKDGSWVQPPKSNRSMTTAFLDDSYRLDLYQGT